MKVLITGASGYFGKLITHRLTSEPDIDIQVIGLDLRRGDDSDEDAKYLTGDTRKKRIEDIFKVEGKIDAVIHLARESASELNSEQMMMTNVYGTFHMLELAQKYNVEKFIFPSSTIVYGARNDNPALIKENHPLLGNRDIREIRDRVDADLVCQTFSRGCLTTPRVIILRTVPIWRSHGAGILNTYMFGTVVPTLLGFDPMFQIIYEREVLEAFILAVKARDACGAFNIPGHIFMPLSEVIRHHGKTPLPMPDFLIHRNGRFLWSRSLQFDFHYLKYPFTVDGTLAKEVLGYDPLKLHGGHIF